MRYRFNVRKYRMNILQKLICTKFQESSRFEGNNWTHKSSPSTRSQASSHSSQNSSLSEASSVLGIHEDKQKQRKSSGFNVISKSSWELSFHPIQLIFLLNLRKRLFSLSGGEKVERVGWTLRSHLPQTTLSSCSSEMRRQNAGFFSVYIPFSLAALSGVRRQLLHICTVLIVEPLSLWAFGSSGSWAEESRKSVDSLGVVHFTFSVSNELRSG